MHGQLIVQVSYNIGISPSTYYGKFLYDSIKFKHLIKNNNKFWAKDSTKYKQNYTDLIIKKKITEKYTIKY